MNKTKLKVGDYVKILSSEKKKYQDIIGKIGQITSIKMNFKYPEYVDTIRVKINGCDLCDTEDGCWLFEREQELLKLESKEMPINTDIYDTIKNSIRPVYLSEEQLADIQENAYKVNFDWANCATKYCAMNEPPIVGKESTLTIIDDERVNENKVEENKKMKLVDLYCRKEEEKIREKFNKQREEIKCQEEDYKTLFELSKKDTNTMHECISLNKYVFTKDTVDKLIEVDTEETKAIDKLNDLVGEVDAQLEICTEYDDQIKILKLYDILDKTGKVSK